MFEVDLPRPRCIQQVRFEPELLSIYRNIREALRSEVRSAHARSTMPAVQ